MSCHHIIRIPCFECTLFALFEIRTVCLDQNGLIKFTRPKNRCSAQHKQLVQPVKSCSNETPGGILKCRRHFVARVVEKMPFFVVKFELEVMKT